MIFNRLRSQVYIQEEIHDKKYLREIFLFIVVIFVIFTEWGIHTSLNYFSRLGGITVIVEIYAFLKTYTFGSNLEQGYVGHIYSFPISRWIESFLYTFYDSIIFSTMIIIIIGTDEYLQAFTISFQYLAYIFILCVSILSVFISFGRLLALYFQDGLISMAILICLYFAIRTISPSQLKFLHYNLLSGPFINFLSENGIGDYVVVGYGLIFISFILSLLSDRFLKRIDLRNGR